MNNKENAYTIKQLAEEKELSTVYIRRAILSGKLESKKVKIGESKVERHMITEEQFAAWRSQNVTRSRREDGRSKFVLYANAEELEKIQALLEKNKIEAIVQKANVKKVAVATE